MAKGLRVLGLGPGLIYSTKAFVYMPFWAVHGLVFDQITKSVSTFEVYCLISHQLYML